MSQERLPPTPRDFESYRLFTEQAAKASNAFPELTVLHTTIRSDWDNNVLPEHKVDLAKQMRALLDSNKKLDGEEGKLKKILKNITTTEKERISETVEALKLAIAKRSQALEVVRECFISLEQSKERWSGGALENSIQLYLRNGITGIEESQRQTKKWMALKLGNLRQTKTDLTTLRRQAEYIKRGLESPSTGKSPPASKRPLDDNPNADDPDGANRPSKRKAAGVSQNAQPGASRGRNSQGTPPNDQGDKDGPAETDAPENEAGTGTNGPGDESAPANVEAPEGEAGAGTDGPGNNDATLAEADAPENGPGSIQGRQTPAGTNAGSGAANPPQQPYLAGLPFATLPPLFGDGHGPSTTRLFADERHYTLPFIRFCRRMLPADLRHVDVEDLEPIATALTLFNQHTHRDHDWDNEFNMPYVVLPHDRGRRMLSKVEDFQLFWQDRNGTPLAWPNVRRLLDLAKREGNDCWQYFIRHIYVAPTTMNPDANALAGQLIGVLQDRLRDRPGLDWSQENDIWDNATKDEVIKAMPLEHVQGGGVWNCLGLIGQGGNGRAILYAKMGPDGRFQQRIIAKHSYIGLQWDWPFYWQGPMRDRVPIEPGVHRLLPKHRHIVEYLGFHLIERLRVIRHYTAFAEFGDLQTLTSKHKDARSHLGPDGQPVEARIPVVALLYTFEAMAATVCLMAYGVTPNDQGEWPDDGGDGDEPSVSWGHSIVHRDIKLLNFFLARPTSSSSSTIWPDLPVVTLGDFGNSMYMNMDMYDAAYKDIVPQAIPQIQRWGGTELWMAPEQTSNHPTEYPVTPATNVYQVGLCIMALMTLSEDPAYQVQTENNHPRGPLFPAGAKDFYPARIVDLAGDCLRLHAEERPLPKKLYMDIRNFVTAYPIGSHGVPFQFQKVPKNQFVRTSLISNNHWV